MNKQVLVRLCVVVTLCSSLQVSYAQGVWATIKEKAKSAWNSDTRKEAWEKTKEKTKEVTSNVMDSELMSSMRYTVPVTDRDFYNFVPDDYILSLSDKQYKSYLSQSRASINSKQKEQVNRVSKKLIEATKRIMSEADRDDEIESFKWEINLVQNKEANAFCMPGGKIVVYDGILSTATDDASLACVIGHEIAHAIAKHSSEQMSKELMSTVGLAVIYSIIANRDMSKEEKKMASVLASSGITLANLKFSRLNETEADRLGLIIAAVAGYDPNAAISFWQRMSANSTNKSSHDWYSTHPSHTNRISNLKSFLPEAKKWQRKCGM